MSTFIRNLFVEASHVINKSNKYKIRIMWRSEWTEVWDCLERSGKKYRDPPCAVCWVSLTGSFPNLEEFLRMWTVHDKLFNRLSFYITVAALLSDIRTALQCLIMKETSFMVKKKKKFYHWLFPQQTFERVIVRKHRCK